MALSRGPAGKPATPNGADRRAAQESIARQGPRAPPGRRSCALVTTAKGVICASGAATSHAGRRSVSRLGTGRSCSRFSAGPVSVTTRARPRTPRRRPPRSRRRGTGGGRRAPTRATPVAGGGRARSPRWRRGEDREEQAQQGFRLQAAPVRQPRPRGTRRSRRRAGRATTASAATAPAQGGARRRRSQARPGAPGSLPTTPAAAAGALCGLVGTAVAAVAEESCCSLRGDGVEGRATGRV